MLQFVAAQFFMIALAVLAAVSLVIIGSSRRRLRASVAGDFADSVIGGIVFAALVASANVYLAAAAFIPSSRDGYWAQYLLVPFLYLAGLASLAVLDS